MRQAHLQSCRDKSTLLSRSPEPMKSLALLVGWFILFVLCWPLIWLISIPLRLIGISVGAALALIKAILR